MGSCGISEIEAQGPIIDGAVLAAGESWLEWPGKIVFRMRMLNKNVGMFISPKGGEHRARREESRAYTKVPDGLIRKTEDRVVTTFSLLITWE